MHRAKINGNGETSFVVVTLVLPYLLSAAAFYVCFGLFLATWLRQIGQAVGTALTVVLATTVAWPYLVNAVAGISDGTCYLSMASPPGTLIAMAMNTTTASTPHMCAALLLWTSLYGVGAVMLYKLTLRIFDRSFGRATQLDDCKRNSS